MGCLRQLFCDHEWKHRFVVDGCDTAISCYCWKCEKRKLATHFWPYSDDEVLVVSRDASLISALIRNAA